MKSKITKAVFDQLPAPVQSLYEANGADYQLTAANAAIATLLQNTVTTPPVVPPVVPPAPQLTQADQDWRASLERQLSTVVDTNKRLEKQLKTTTLDKAVLGQLSGLGVHPGAETFALEEVKAKYEVNETGQIVQRDTKNIVFSKKDAAKPMPVEEYVANVLPVERKFLFQGNTGARSGTETKPASAAQAAQSVDKNPWSKHSWNMTQQLIVSNQDKGKAEQWKAEAATEK